MFINLCCSSRSREAETGENLMVEVNYLQLWWLAVYGVADTLGAGHVRIHRQMWTKLERSQALWIVR